MSQQKATYAHLVLSERGPYVKSTRSWKAISVGPTFFPFPLLVFEFWVLKAICVNIFQRAANLRTGIFDGEARCVVTFRGNATLDSVFCK